MQEKIKLDLHLILPNVPDEKDRCVHRLIDRLSKQSGVEKVHISEGEDPDKPQVCVHFDHRLTSMHKIRKSVRQEGAELTERYGHLSEEVTGIYHETRGRVVEDNLLKVDGILEAEASASDIVNIEYDRTKISRDQIIEKLAKLDVFVRIDGKLLSRGRLPGIGKKARLRTLITEHIQLLFSLLCGFFLLTGWMSGFFEPPVAHFSLPLLITAYFFGSYYTLIQVYQSLRIGKFNIDLLMLIAATGAAILGAWSEGALLLFLFSLGHALEHYAMGRARKAIEALATITPDTAIVRRGGRQEIVPVEELQPGDLVIVKPNERFPADGFVTDGNSSVDQSPITGESIPVDKEPVRNADEARSRPTGIESRSRIFAGTINGNHPLEVEVLSRSEDSTMSRMVRLVREAETHKSPTQRFAVRFERIFVPAILIFVFLLMFAWLIIDEPFSGSFYRAMAVLVAASPCALAISTPSAILSGVARAARMGVLIKGGAPLEELGLLRAIAFDKTGTLTEGRPRITEIIVSDGVDEESMLGMVVALEKMSDHPLARAVVRDGTSRLGSAPLPELKDVEVVTGKGIRARLNGQLLAVGTAGLFADDAEENTEGENYDEEDAGLVHTDVARPVLPELISKTVQELHRKGRTTMIVKKGENYLGVIGLMDTPREKARSVVEKLKKLGFDRLIMISGDHQLVADSIAEHIGLDEARGDLLPEQKVETILKLIEEETLVGMVGDGVNDAPAMANSSVGIAMGAAGSDVALETADIALMADDLEKLPQAVALSRRTRQIIKQNLWISLGMIAFLVPATMFGLANIGVAVLLHEGSTLVVVLNALRLLGFKA